MGFLAAVDNYGIEEQDDDLYFDHLHGRVMKVDINGDEFDPRLFDRNNGEGSAEKAIEKLRNNGGKN